MTYAECKKIIDDAVTEYCNNGGSLLNIALNHTVKEYIYEFDTLLSEDTKEKLIDKAHRAMQREEDLPPGIKLVKMVFK
jgi:hypothetical protein